MPLLALLSASEQLKLKMTHVVMYKDEFYQDLRHDALKVH